MEDSRADFTMTVRQLSEVSPSQLENGSAPQVHQPTAASQLETHTFSPLDLTSSLYSQCGLFQSSHRRNISQTGFSCIQSVCPGQVSIMYSLNSDHRNE